jgi:hypothetical protein
MDACVIGKQYELLEYLVKNTRKGINNFRAADDQVPPKYKMNNFLDLDYFWKSRQSKDLVGNNTCHIVFSMIDDETLRFKFLKLLCEEGIGDMNKRNCLGYLPCENLHSHPIKNIPKDLEPYFVETLQEI